VRRRTAAFRGVEIHEKSAMCGVREPVALRIADRGRPNRSPHDTIASYGFRREYASSACARPIGIR
jgi:hypothetical protein